ncbi:MAG: hypothetical protein ACAI44_36730 [Candidatus Sericytochromatia bacterium]
MSVQFTATGPQPASGAAQDVQRIQGNESTRWNSLTTAKDNADIPVTANGAVVGYVDAQQATRMRDLASQGYAITDPSGNAVTVGSIDSPTSPGDVSKHFDNAFSNFFTAHHNVSPSELLNFVKGYFPNVNTVDEAVRVVLRNSNYEAAVVSEHSVGVGDQHRTEAGHESTPGTVNFFTNAQSQTFQNQVGSEGIVTYAQEQSGAIAVTRPGRAGGG